MNVNSDTTNTNTFVSRAFSEIRGACNTAWGVINRREEISARHDEVNTVKFFAINASLWFSSMALFYPAEVLKTRQQVNRAPFSNPIAETKTQVFLFCFFLFSPVWLGEIHGWPAWR